MNSMIFRLGSEAFREFDYQRALCMYNKAIDHVKDSPILYNNRALTYIRFVYLFSNSIKLEHKKCIPNDFAVCVCIRKRFLTLISYFKSWMRKTYDRGCIGQNAIYCLEWSGISRKV